MDPVSALLLAMWIAGYFVRNVYQDSVYKATGKLPPSYLREVERRERRGQSDRPGRRFWRNAAVDAWEEADARRARRFAKRRERLREQWGEQDAIEDAEKQAWEDNRARDRAEEEAYERNVPRGRCEVCDAETAEVDLKVRRKPAGGLAWTCPACAAAIDDARRNSGTEGPADADSGPGATAPHQPQQDAPATGTEEEPTEKPDPNSTQNDSRDAQVIQLHARPPITTEQENDSMETTSLNAGLTYTQRMAASAQQGVSSVETSIASMTSGGVTGPAIAELHAAQEALSNAAAHFNAAHTALGRHIQVQEAYAANKDAGNRDFVRAD